MPHLLVLGSRNLGRVIAEHLIDQGWEATGVARSAETAEAFPGTGVVADVTTAEGMRAAVAQAGAFDLAVNAVSPKGRFGGGDLVDDRRRGDVALSGAGAPDVVRLLPHLRRGAHGARRRDHHPGHRRLRPPGPPGRAPWGAGAAGQRALSQAAANELKPHGVHAALLVCDGTFGGPGDDAGGERIDTRELAKAVQYLHEQGRGAWTHELVVTPVGDRWTP